ncbi:MAG: YhdH/YhfP family quinone oxidoreductase [bacterium]|nr:YhdH/YhfP family quinone oxidoreductase [bacterium]
MTYKALLVRQENDAFVRNVEPLKTDNLPEGDVLIRVQYSSLNYKDALSATGNRGVTKNYPHTPGIDAAGIVEESSTEAYQPGDEVIVTSYDLGMNTSGGFGQYIRVPSDWIVPPPDGLSLKESMTFGTAGFTAALSVHKLEQAGVQPDQGEILVTGATGGVGSLAVAILAKAGYPVAAATGKSSQKEFLQRLGATNIISRDEIQDAENRPLLKSRWAGVVDTVGGNILSTAIKSTHYGGAVTCCGLVAGPELPTTVFPFILRGISLLGVDSANCPMSVRLPIWQKLAGPWKTEHLDHLTSECSLENLSPEIDRILAGQQTGRTVVNLNL